MELLQNPWVSLIAQVVLFLFIVFGARYVVAFRMKLRKPRGRDIDITVQTTVEAKDAKQAIKIAYSTLSEEQKAATTKVFLVRDDMGDRQNNPPSD